MEKETLEGATSAEAKAKESNKETESKVKVMMTVSGDHALSSFLNSLKSRGVKNPNLGELILDALSTLEEDWWKDKLDELTPLEYRVKQALSNPESRERLASFLNEVEA